PHCSDIDFSSRMIELAVRAPREAQRVISHFNRHRIFDAALHLVIPKMNAAEFDGRLRTT
ncbi:hypothetical protein, partial [Rhizobium rhizogenes]|uniref:hypothetical protein n=1 Tax=Rhizobium rhizogenes TaxID=359 RepID=UPI001AEC55E6